MERETIFKAGTPKRTFFNVNRTSSGYFTVERPSPHIVAGLVFDVPSLSWIFVKQFRPPVNKYCLELVAGLDDKSQDLETTMKEEVIEETGYKPVSIRFLGSFAKSPGIINEIENMYFIETMGKIAEGGGVEADGESIEVVRIPMTAKGIRGDERDDVIDSLAKLRSDDLIISSGIYTAIALSY